MHRSEGGLFVLALVCVWVGVAAAATSCSVSQRTGCGFIGIDQATCEGSTYNCCWDSSVAPYCYESETAAPSPSPAPVTPSGDSYQKTFVFSGGVSFCSQCGENGQYACSDKSNWNGNNLVFMDATPPGYIVTKIQVDLVGSFACQNTGVNDIQVKVNQDTVDILSAAQTYQCACSTCDGTITYLSENPYGFPFNYLANNNLSITSLYNVICLNKAVITVSFAKDQLGLTAITKRTSLSSGSSYTVTPGECGATKYVDTSYYYGSAKFSFSDPLPKGSILVSATFDLYGRYFGSSCSSSRTVTVSMGLAPSITQTISKYNTSLPINPNHCQSSGCDGYWRFPQTTLYQNGWPGYNYGTSNTVTVSNTASATCDIAFVDVRLWYISYSK